MFKNLFRTKKSPLKLLGRGGICYNDGENEYYIDSENILSKDAGIDIAIYYNGTKLMNSEAILPESEKKRIAFIVKDLLEQDGGKIGVFPG